MTSEDRQNRASLIRTNITLNDFNGSASMENGVLKVELKFKLKFI
jgi:hypothetical protein